ncbi:hypothetical protein DACRYDRAFT_48587 [Dacryopinax primogenitus]|uniref:Auxin efflux carrier n=1 Tax=Dacryopinax primogenitus (strain DJM 731) TaxID=1858805 RepID=M5G6B4_DACPD|nr:uncharacterized protein DACRYDRAFT_48587 [Dacryopinax primogenitus]EJU04229.1 hypothetical protein DACRYDRAFT_48587 [Dacryopinax primogenitus]
MPSPYVLSSLLESFLASLQAALSVLLTLLYGVISSYLGWLSSDTAKEVAQLCIEIFQPALIITEIGQNIAQEGSSVFRLWPIVAWAVAYPVISLLLTYPLLHPLQLPRWSLLAAAFNNTTALPLLLIESLATTGILELIVPDAQKAKRTATTYLLLNAMVNNVLTFAVGKPLLVEKGWEESVMQAEDVSQRLETVIEDIEAEAEAEDASRGYEEESDPRDGEASPLLQKSGTTAGRIESALWTTRGFARLPPPVQKALVAGKELFSPPLIGTILAVAIGLTPALRTAFFAVPKEGGVLRAWVTSSLEDIGRLYSSLQMFVVGSKLYESSSTLTDSSQKEGKPSSWPLAYILFLRFLLIPGLSIGLIYSLATRTTILGTEPLLWFVLMLVPAGPSAINISSIAEVAGAGEETVQQIARFLTLEYAISPLVCLAVVGSLQAAAAAKAIVEQ